MNTVDTNTFAQFPELTMDRYWLLTWTTYGTWLPGDGRGSVTSIRERAKYRFEHDEPGTPYEDALPGLEEAARRSLKGPPIYLTVEQANLLLAQFQQTATYRSWALLGVALMANHLHLVVGVPDDPDPESLVRDFKSYGSRALNQQFGKPKSATWWAVRGGSRRRLKDESAIGNALVYLRDQEFPLVMWFADGYASFTEL